MAAREHASREQRYMPRALDNLREVSILSYLTLTDTNPSPSSGVGELELRYLFLANSRGTPLSLKVAFDGCC